MTKVIKDRDGSDSFRPDTSNRYEVLYEHSKYLQKKHSQEKGIRMEEVEK